jgi:hypothetical protein
MYFTAPNLPFLRSSGASPKARQQVGTPRGRRIQAARAREERERDRERERRSRRQMWAAAGETRRRQQAPHLHTVCQPNLPASRREQCRS